MQADAGSNASTVQSGLKWGEIFKSVPATSVDQGGPAGGPSHKVLHKIILEVAQAGARPAQIHPA